MIHTVCCTLSFQKIFEMHGKVDIAYDLLIYLFPIFKCRINYITFFSLYGNTLVLYLTKS